jgi:predicted TIM-barrel fold metal-dependent hydrolase
MIQLKRALLFAFASLSLSTGVCAQISPDQLLLKDYKPHSIFKIPETHIDKARFAVVDMHTHVYATNEAAVDRWVQVMDEVGLEKSIILAGSTGARLDSQIALFGRHPKRFEVWCGFNLSGIDQPGFGPAAIAELERCHKAGAKGVGELSDKGKGLSGAPAVHCDDSRLDPLFEKCAELGMPVNIHIGEDQWMYEPMDEHNDGLMNAYTWKITNAPGVLTHEQVLATLKNMVKKHPRTTIIACHFANCSADLNALGEMFEQFPNLYADMGARFTEITGIPRFVLRFFTKYQDRLLYGTDNTPRPEMYRTSFRILESEDEHFYPTSFSKYHWPSQGFALPDQLLKKIYRDNALKIIKGSQ